jgi:hypothetical protein
MYLLPRVNMELRPRLLELKPGTRIVSHDFNMDDWTPDEKVDMAVKAKYGGAPGTSSIYFWVVPAKAAGVWQWQLTVGGKAQTYALALEQKFQVLSGTLRVNERESKLADVKLRGDQIGFSATADVNGAAVRHVFSGRLYGDSIDGSAALSGARGVSQLEWNASRGAKAAAAALPVLAAVH